MINYWHQASGRQHEPDELVDSAHSQSFLVLLYSMVTVMVTINRWRIQARRHYAAANLSELTTKEFETTI